MELLDHPEAETLPVSKTTLISFYVLLFLMSTAPFFFIELDTMYVTGWLFILFFVPDAFLIIKIVVLLRATVPIHGTHLGAYLKNTIQALIQQSLNIWDLLLLLLFVFLGPLVLTLVLSPFLLLIGLVVQQVIPDASYTFNLVYLLNCALHYGVWCWYHYKKLNASS